MTWFFRKDTRILSKQWFRPMPLDLGPRLDTRRQTLRWTWFAEKVGHFLNPTTQSAPGPSVTHKL